MIKTRLSLNSNTIAKNNLEIGIVSGFINNKHSHEYQVFDLEKPVPTVGKIGVNNQDVFAIQFKFNSQDDFAFSVYLDGVNVSQLNGISSLNEIQEHQRDNYNAHKGLFISCYSPTRKLGYIDRYNQKNGENRQFTFTTQENSGINEILINDPSLNNRIEIYVWREVEEEYDEMIDNNISYSRRRDTSTKVGAGKATNQEYNTTTGLNNPEFLGKVMFIHTNADNVSYLGKALLSIEDLIDPMDRVPRT